MTQNPQFLQDFQNSMNKLNGMNEVVQKSLKQKKEFSDKLVNKLKDINQKIKDLAGEINKLKANVDGLQGQVTTNSTYINDKDAQIAALKERVIALEGEKQQISQQLTNFQKQVNDEKTALQQKIDSDEEQLRKLTDENVTIKNQANALTNELTNKGDLQSQHAEQLKNQTEDFQKQLAAQQQDNQTKIDALIAQIKGYDDKMLELQKQLKDKTDEAAAYAQAATDKQNQGQSQVEQLNQQIVQLKTENEDLVQRIIAATVAIKNATENLQNLADSVPNQETEKYIDQLFSEIELSIQNISGVIQGKPSIQNKTQITPTDIMTLQQIGGPPIKISFNELLDALSIKIKQNAGQKYIDAFNQLRQPGVSGNDIMRIISNNGISFKNNTIMGGKKSKKSKKQKGGFIYKTNTKRRSILTSSSRRKTSKRN